MAKYLLLNDVRTTKAAFHTASIIDDAQNDVSELEISGACMIPYLASQEAHRQKYLSLKKVETRTPTVVLFQYLSIAGLIP